MKLEGLVAWRGRALGCLAAGRPDVHTLLFWAETQNPTIGAAEEQRGTACYRSTPQLRCFRVTIHC